METNLTKEVVSAIVIDAKNNPTRTIRQNLISHCSTIFDFTDPYNIKVNDKKRNLRFRIIPDNTKESFEWLLVFDRNDQQKLKKLLNSKRWGTAVDRIAEHLNSNL